MNPGKNGIPPLFPDFSALDSFPQIEDDALLQLHHPSNRQFDTAIQLPSHVPTRYDEAMRDILPPARRWSCDGYPNISSELPASYYHNLEFVVHSQMHMSNRQVCDFDFEIPASVAASASVSSHSEAGPHVDHFGVMPPTESALHNQRGVMDMRQHQHQLHLQPFNDPAMFDNEFYGDHGRSVSAPNVAIPGAGCANNGNAQNDMGNGNMHGNGGHDFGARRRFRTNFTEHQSLYLENTFRDTHYPDHKQKKDMATFLNIPEDRITVWFQNRRAKWRRKENKERSRSDAYAASSFDYTGFPGPIELAHLPQPPHPVMNPFVEHQELQNFEMKPQHGAHHNMHSMQSGNSSR